MNKCHQITHYAYKSMSYLSSIKTLSSVLYSKLCPCVKSLSTFFVMAKAEVDIFFIKVKVVLKIATLLSFYSIVVVSSSVVDHLHCRCVFTEDSNIGCAEVTGRGLARVGQVN